MGKILITIGIFIVLTGLLLTMTEKVPLVGKLPGDILIKKDNFTFYFPLATSILISIVLSLLFRLFNR